MGFVTRLKNGFSGLMQNSPPQRPQRSPNHVDLNAFKTSMSEAMPGLSQPVWGPEISTVGAYSREGYTSKTFDSPTIPFRIQNEALQVDEDVQLSINHLASQVTGGEHYIKGLTTPIVDHFEQLFNDIEFDTFDTILVKELLWEGNSVWKPRLGIQHVRSLDDLMHIPISSFVRIWWDRQRIPYKYEFRGTEYQGYHNPDEIIHFKWNPINASVFGTGFGISMTSPRFFTQPTSSGDEEYRMPPLLERKYATQFNMQIAEQKYISRNVWQAEGGSEDDRKNLQAQVENLGIGQDVVAGTKIKVDELGSQARNFNAEQFTDITMGPIMKALNDFRGKEAGTSQHSYANAETSKVLDEIGLSAFPISVKEQIKEKIVKPWYAAHPYFCPDYMMGMIPYAFEDTEFELEFGEQEKKDLSTDDYIKLLDSYMMTPIPKDPVEIRKLYEKGGLPLTKEVDSAIDNQYNDPNGDMAMQQAGIPNNMDLPQRDMGGGEIPPDFSSGTTSPPMDEPIYDSMAQQIRPDMKRDVRGKPPNPNQDWQTGRGYE